tara:strand:+ start:414 stop:530 length:117 start_codon:yes stop_codon:yes gene_type:complete
MINGEENGINKGGPVLRLGFSRGEGPWKRGGNTPPQYL